MKYPSSIFSSKTGKALCFKLVIGALVVLTTQFALFHLCGPFGFYVPHGSVINQLRGAPGEAVYFGDSVTLFVGSKDKNRTYLPEMLGELTPETKIFPIRHFAYHLGIFSEYLFHLSQINKMPSLVIVPINISQFSPLWFSGPRYQFVKERTILRYASNPWMAPFLTALLSFRAFNLNPIDESEFHKMSLRNGETVVAHVGDLKDVRANNVTADQLKTYFMGWYLNPIPKDHERLSDLQRIVQITNQTRTRVIFYLTPIDYQSGDRLVGPHFSQQLQENASLVQAVLDRNGAHASDFTRSISSKHFAWPTDEKLPSEHLNESGREQLAHLIAKEIERAGSTLWAQTSF